MNGPRMRGHRRAVLKYFQDRLRSREFDVRRDDEIVIGERQRTERLVERVEFQMWPRQSSHLHLTGKIAVHARRLHEFLRAHSRGKEFVSPRLVLVLDLFALGLDPPEYRPGTAGWWACPADTTYRGPLEHAWTVFVERGEPLLAHLLTEEDVVDCILEHRLRRSVYEVIALLVLGRACESHRSSRA